MNNEFLFGGEEEEAPSAFLEGEEEAPESEEEDAGEASDNSEGEEKA